MRLADDESRHLVGGVVSRAARRLARPACAEILSDFTDASGGTLQTALDRQALTAQGFLEELFFYDGSTARTCASANVVAFTSPGSRVVFICPQQFRAQERRNPFEAEALVIHEALHALGLGENPPSSREITRLVKARCL